MKKFIALLLVALMLTLTFTGCGNKNENSENKSQIDNAAEDSSNNENSAIAETLAEYKVEKTGAIEGKKLNIETAGLTYLDSNGKYGIISLDTKHDTDAVYSFVRSMNSYFIVSKNKTEVNSVSEMNCFGVVDSYGKEIIPMQYASISALNDRYVKVSKVTKATDNKENALVFASNSWLVVPSDSSEYFEGVWYIYDLNEGKFVDKATGTKAYISSAKGDTLEIRNDNNEKIVIKSDGKVVEEKVERVFDNGCYSVNDADNTIIYDSEGKNLFTCGKDDFEPSSSADNYFLASKYEDGNMKYAVMDKNGKLASAEFDESIIIVNELILSDGKVYDFNKKEVTDGKYTSLKYEHYRNTYYLYDSVTKNFKIIDKNGNVILSGSENDAYTMDSNYYLAKKKTGDSSYIYCVKDEDYTVKGVGIAPWLVRTADDNKSVVDTATGKTLLEGYSDYQAHCINDSTICVVAVNAEGNCDIYKVMQ